MNHVPRPFELRISSHFARDIATLALAQPEFQDVPIVVTPNINEIARTRRSSALRRAYRDAARVLCDDWLVQLYARIRDFRLTRATVRETTPELARIALDASVRWLFFVTNNDATRQAILGWTPREVDCDVAVLPFGFKHDAAYCTLLAASMNPLSHRFWSWRLMRHEARFS